MTQMQSDEQQPASPPAKKEALLIFQGGGAKGIVHVGALMAVEDMELAIRGVAGTSAGAIVAALVAAGFESADLVDLENNTHLLQKEFGGLKFNRPTDLFGPYGWKLLRLASGAVYWGPTLIALALFAALYLFHYGYDALSLTLSILCVVLPVVFVVWVSTGIASTDHVRKFIDAVLKTRIPSTSEQGVTFADLARAGRVPLKIVATNVSEERAEVFSVDRTPEVAIADAVAASICLPVIFQPHRFACKRGNGITADVRERSYLDGGLISNLPVWTLDDEREKHDSESRGELLTIAFGIEAKAPQEGAGQEPEPLGLLPALISAVVAGTLELDMRKVPNAYHFMMACTLKLMDFHKSQDVYFEAVKKARGLALGLLRDDLENFPKNIANACQAIQKVVADSVNLQHGVWHSSTAPTVRIAIAMQQRGSYASPAWTLASGFPAMPEASPDTAWEEGIPVFGGYTGGQWPGAHWRLVIPVSGRRARPPKDSSRMERGLVVAVECDALPEPALDDISGFYPFIDALDNAVVDFCYKTGIYTAVQRSTSSPWN